MLYIPRLFGLHAEPSPRLNIFLASLPFIIFIAAYIYIANARHEVNPDDTIMPTIGQMIEKIDELAFTPDRRKGQYLMLEDTLTSLKRIGIGLGSAAFLGLLFGMNMGLFRGMEALSSSFLRFIGTVPPMAILTILLITFGTEETSKFALIFIMTFFTITGNIFLATKKIPRQKIVKALTLGASQLDVVYRVVFPLILPVLINQMRLSIGPAITALIASEAIAAQSGLGYRIFMLTRVLSMDGILPYVLWITFLGWLADWLLCRLLSWKFKWYLRANQ